MTDNLLTAMTATGLAPAKLNLSLRCVGRKTNGYHLLEMLNVPFDMCDQLTLSLFSDGRSSSVTVKDQIEENKILAPCAPRLSANLIAELESCASNIAARAVAQTLAALKLNFTFHLSLVKQIPVGAGLGGGSSDAACAIKLTLEIAGRIINSSGPIPQLSPEGIAQLALELGADVPYFLSAGPALVEGIGEIVTAIDMPVLQAHSVALFMPSFAINTAQVYALLRAENGLGLVKNTESPLLAELLARRYNDLQRFAVQLQPDLAQLLAAIEGLNTRFSRTFPYSGMSGSGSACFVVFPSNRCAELTPYFDQIASAHKCTIKICALRLQPD